MSTPQSRLQGLFAELKRRHVIQMAIVYFVVAFALIEAADLAAPRLQIPDWTITLLLVLALAGFPVMLVLTWIYELSPEGLRRTETLVATEADGRRSIAVLPFADMSPDHDQEYFSDGMSEELINALTKLEGLRVAARTSAFAFKGKEEDVRTIGRKLGVATVLEGSVRKAGNRLRITAQLINVADGYHLWSETYDRELEDVFAIQDEISQAIVSTLQLTLAVGEGERLVPPATTNMEAYDLYLKGRHHWYKRYKVGLQVALEYFQKAIACDPNFALPYTGLADAFMMMGTMGLMPPDQARGLAVPAAERALALDGELADAHFSMAAIKMFLLWDWEGSDEEFRRGVELNRTHAMGHVWWAVLLAARGRVEESLKQAAAASAADPDSPYVATHVGQARVKVGRYEEAIRVLERALEVEPEGVAALFHLACAYCGMSRHDEAIATLEKAVALSNRAPAFVAALGAVYGRALMVGEAQGLLDELHERSSGEYVSPVVFAVILATLGESEEAFRRLEAGVEEMDPILFTAVGSPLLDSIRADDRFDALLERMGLES